MFEGQTWWIVGASEGLGRALAKEMDGAGARLILSARNAGRLQHLCDGLSNARALRMDVTDPDDVIRAIADLGPVDGVVYCAGAYDPLSAQDWQPEAVETMCAVNFTGALRVLGQIVPQFCRRDSGHIVLIGSLAGFTGLPGAIGYGASKAALMHLGENLQADLRGSGVQVQVINPGFIRTRLTQKNEFKMPQILEPEDAARRCLHAMQGRRFSTSFPAPFSWVFTLGRLLPRRLFLKLM
ncbi:SDR family NAD(P)-dependent oxidoreductase [Phaeobacter gallaeciensis]|uniref:SDR family NAD(P)-dependent oxidoreductase n=1 Tax=Phaeobacter gallaeciensis TaxID=60890 RepID=UPI00237F47AC|nr:SDR family NAD(P)-dependent oxidoreductase [Phaeobacter gallaeciensis]MDE4302321.1 SDR family NAD(P)-dependent oxidoreductase [Phaeobacter gallaeciensis]MDE4306701.1 SDR family NAD(P)-dependent oxidoreductase [Phaeobacter gallaeciensis]MDE4311180.1 SDR family NAD(P)-dependent oxidoreductase [Phaeobacter gallaeciensis]MDE4315643.1 SDR family NAD(P)-dependent oxidoreductase [Phaeobacter gallaeciensis]MDE4320107.1 SDR family NAD(P)-dependent oxidoreductase [Phaeobacter gallaeciensis]